MGGPVRRLGGVEGGRVRRGACGGGVGVGSCGCWAAESSASECRHSRACDGALRECRGAARGRRRGAARARRGWHLCLHERQQQRLNATSARIQACVDMSTTCESERSPATRTAASVCTECAIAVHFARRARLVRRSVRDVAQDHVQLRAHGQVSFGEAEHCVRACAERCMRSTACARHARAGVARRSTDRDARASRARRNKGADRLNESDQDCARPCVHTLVCT